MLRYSEPVSERIEKLIQALFLVLFFTLPLAQKLTSAVTGLLLLLSIVGWLGKREKVYVPWFLPLLFLYYAASEWLSGGTWAPVERRLLFVIVPLIFGINAHWIDSTFRKKAGQVFIGGILFTLVYDTIRAGVRSFALKDGVLVFNPRVIQETSNDFLTSSIYGGNYFFGNDFSPFMDASYFGLYIVLAQYLIYELAQTPTCSNRQRRWLIGTYVFLLLALFLLSNKATIISSGILTTYITIRVFFFTRASPSMRLAISAGLIAVLSLFVFLNPRMRLFKETFWAGLAINPNARWGHDLRVLSWDASLDVIRNNWLMGVGEGNKESALIALYKAKGYVVPAEEMHNSHNQFLDLLIGGGLFAFGLFMTGFIQLVVKAIRNRNNELLVFTLLFAFSALFENLLTRYAGVLFFAAFMSLLETGKKDE